MTLCTNPVEATYELCNQFRETLKPIFKLLALKVNEIANEFEYNATFLEDNYIQKSDLKRDDTIDVVGKYINGEVHLGAEDIITDGTIKAR